MPKSELGKKFVGDLTVHETIIYSRFSRDRVAKIEREKDE